MKIVCLLKWVQSTFSSEYNVFPVRMFPFLILLLLVTWSEHQGPVRKQMKGAYQGFSKRCNNTEPLCLTLLGPRSFLPGFYEPKYLYTIFLKQNIWKALELPFSIMKLCSRLLNFTWEQWIKKICHDKQHSYPIGKRKRKRTLATCSEKGVVDLFILLLKCKTSAKILRRPSKSDGKP